MEQVWLSKTFDGRLFERHVYSGPQGDGYIDIYHDVKDTHIETTYDHHGPEQRDVSPKVTDDEAILTKMKRIKEEKAEWKPNTGFEIKDEFKNDYLEDGKLKPVEPPVEDPKDKEPK